MVIWDGGWSLYSLATNALEPLKFFQQDALVMIRTGLQKLDEILLGGIPDGVIVDIFGGNATGKTQMLLQLTANLIGDYYRHDINGDGGGTDDYDEDDDDDYDIDGGPRVLYLDTTGEFRPERLLQMQPDPRAGTALLERVTVSRPTNTSQLIKTMQGMGGADFSLVVIDNVTDLFSYEYGALRSKNSNNDSRNIELSRQRNQMFTRYMHDLSWFAIRRRVPVVVTNMMRYAMADDAVVENMKGLIDPFTHIKIHLSRNQRSEFSGHARWALGEGTFAYEIRTEGLCELAHT